MFSFLDNLTKFISWSKLVESGADSNNGGDWGAIHAGHKYDTRSTFILSYDHNENYIFGNKSHMKIFTTKLCSFLFYFIFLT